MVKNEFKELFNKLYNITKESTYDLAEHFSVTPKTVIKWLDGKSVPATMVRSAVIKKLYEEQQKKEQAELIGKIIKEFVRIEIKEPGYYESLYTVKLLFDGEVFDEKYFDIEKCKCDGGSNCC